jgi:putative flippase GtrA
MAIKVIDQPIGVLREFIKYLTVSAIALFVDYSAYWIIAYSELMELTGAAVVGYIAGLIVAYFLISKRVFSNGWLSARRTYEVLLFALSGVLGIALTYVSVKFYVLAFGENIHGAKILAVGVSFVVTYLFRKLFVFKPAKKYTADEMSL